eukprot:m.102607 g.102607  ORF g.102607 m.102607 type:complete len:101 (+) comp27419_c0_seq1:299-601(+)
MNDDDSDEWYDCDQDQVTQIRHETECSMSPPPQPTPSLSRWFELPSPQNFPGKRSGHMSMVHREELYVFGGYNEDTDPDEDTEIYYDLTVIWKWNNDTLM